MSSEKNPVLDVISDDTFILYDTETVADIFPDDSLETCIIAEGSKRIGENVCRLLSFKRLEIPETVTEICDRAFHGCFNLKEIVFKGKLDKMKIADTAFCKCNSLEKVEFLGEYDEEYDIAFSEYLEDIFSYSPDVKVIFHVKGGKLVEKRLSIEDYHCDFNSETRENLLKENNVVINKVKGGGIENYFGTVKVYSERSGEKVFESLADKVFTYDVTCNDEKLKCSYYTVNKRYGFIYMGTGDEVDRIFLMCKGTGDETGRMFRRGIIENNKISSAISGMTVLGDYLFVTESILTCEDDSRPVEVSDGKAVVYTVTPHLHIFSLKRPVLVKSIYGLSVSPFYKKDGDIYTIELIYNDKNTEKCVGREKISLNLSENVFSRIENDFTTDSISYYYGE